METLLRIRIVRKVRLKVWEGGKVEKLLGCSLPLQATFLQLLYPMNSLAQRIQNGSFLPELQFQTSKSGGPGGQNVNKVETKVQLRFDVNNSLVLSEEEKLTLLQKAKNKIDQEGVLQLMSQEKRSQIQNKELVIQKFYELLKSAFAMKKIRKATKPRKSSIEKRLKKKKALSEKKANRNWKM